MRLPSFICHSTSGSLAWARRPVLLVCLLFLVSPLCVAASGSLEAAIQAFRGGDLPRAKVLFLEAYASGHSSAKLSYNLGVVHYRLEEYAQAELFFAEAAQYPVSRQIAQYNLARCAEMKLDFALAKRWYEQARQGDDLRIADLATRASLALVIAGRRRQSFGGSMGFGIDSAVVGLIDQVTSLPTDIPDTFLEAAAYWAYEGIALQHGALAAELSAYALGYDTVEIANIQSAAGRLRWENEKTGAQRMGLQWSLAHEWLNANAYQLRTALQFDLGHAWRNSWMKYVLSAERVSAQSRVVTGIEGWRFDASASALQRWGQGVAVARLIGQYNDREEAQRSPYRYGFEFLWRGPVTNAWIATPGLQLRMSDYPSIEDSREQRSRLFLRLEETPSAAAWRPRVELIYERNRSDDPARRYEHLRLVLSLIFAAN
jgi:hypothetical protein